jgi:FAD/FMN-containing dehydrogenase
MQVLDQIAAVIGQTNILTGAEAAAYGKDWTGAYHASPLAVLRPADRDQVSAILKIAHDSRTAIVPCAGRTGLTGATMADGALMLSVERLNRIGPINTATRSVTVGAGVILSSLHDAAHAQDLIFPLTLGARGSAMIGGLLATNAGGSNVVRYGSTRGLCLGLEVVLADGRVMDLMTDLHKDNSGYDLRNLMIGSEGTLGVITAAVLKLLPRPRAYATAMVAMHSLPDALDLLHHLQDISGGGVEAFEYMPDSYLMRHAQVFPDMPPVFAQSYPVNIMIELAATTIRDATANSDGSLPVAEALATTLARFMDQGRILDAIIAQNDSQRAMIWKRREDAGHVAFYSGHVVNTDIALPLDRIAVFQDRLTPRLRAIDPDVSEMLVAHLGDGNIHHTSYASRNDPALMEALTEAVEDVVQELGGSFSAEHGIGLSKRATMRRRKDPVALDTMRAIKAALDPRGILNPGKVIPPI